MVPYVNVIALIEIHDRLATALPCPIPLHSSFFGCNIAVGEIPYAVCTLCFICFMVITIAIPSSCDKPHLCSAIVPKLGNIISYHFVVARFSVIVHSLFCLVMSLTSCSVIRSIDVPRPLRPPCIWSPNNCLFSVFFIISLPTLIFSTTLKSASNNCIICSLSILGHPATFSIIMCIDCCQCHSENPYMPGSDISFSSILFASTISHASL